MSQTFIYKGVTHTKLQLERELQTITDIDHISHEEKMDYYKPRIYLLAQEEAAHSPRMTKLLDAHTAELETIDDGNFFCFILLLPCNTCTGFKLLLETVHFLETVIALLIPRSKPNILHRFSVSPPYLLYTMC